MIIGLFIITGVIFIKYKPLYKVTVDGEVIGYIENRNKFQNRIYEYINTNEEECIAFKTLKIDQNYELEFVTNKSCLNEDEVYNSIIEKTEIIYTMYAIVVNEDITSYVETEEEAQNAVNKLNEQYKEENIEIGLRQIYTETKPEIVESEIAVAQISSNKIDPIVTSRSGTTSRSANSKTSSSSKTSIVNGVSLKVQPVSGIITSKFGSRSSVRSGAHTGLDIATKKGTPIKAVTEGTVIFAGTSGSYGKLIKISHGNGIETWYAHCNKLYVNKGEQVLSGDIIAEVGSTGNSTGPHLHLEIRIDGTAVDPQKYMY